MCIQDCYIPTNLLKLKTGLIKDTNFKADVRTVKLNEVSRLISYF